MAISNVPRRLTNMFLEPYRSFALGVRFKDKSGQAIDLTDCVVRLVVSQPSQLGGAEVIQQVAEEVDLVGGEVAFPIQASQMVLAEGEYPFDITYINAGGYSVAAASGFWIVSTNVDIDSTNVYETLGSPQALEVTLDDVDVIEVTVTAAQGEKGDKGDKGDQGVPGGAYIQPDEPAEDDPLTHDGLWVDTDEAAPDLKNELKNITSASTDFADFQTRIAAW